MALPPKLTKFTTTSDVIKTVDYIDTILGVGYKKFYIAGGADSGGKYFFLTTDATISSDKENFNILASLLDEDVDIAIGGDFTVAEAEAILQTNSRVVSGSSQTVTWTLRHVDSAGTETTVGTIVGETTNGQAGRTYFRKDTKMPTTRTKFKKGDTLRLNFTTVSGASDYLGFSPSGLFGQTTEAPNFTFSSYILIPIEVNL